MMAKFKNLNEKGRTLLINLIPLFLFMIVHVIIAQRRHGVPKVVERGGGRAVMMLVVVVLVKTVGLVMDAVGVVATAAAGQVVVDSTFFSPRIMLRLRCYVYNISG